MTDFAPATISPAVQDRYDRALTAYRHARAEWLEAWTAMQRERYAREQGPPDPEEDCSDLG